MANRKIEYIEWYDHGSESAGWKKLKKYENKPSLCVTVGHVIMEDKKALTVVSSWCDSSGVFDGDVTIIKSCIRKRRTLK